MQTPPHPPWRNDVNARLCVGVDQARTLLRKREIDVGIVCFEGSPGTCSVYLIKDQKPQPSLVTLPGWRHIKLSGTSRADVNRYDVACTSNEVFAALAKK